MNRPGICGCPPHLKWMLQEACVQPRMSQHNLSPCGMEGLSVGQVFYWPETVLDLSRPLEGLL